MRAGIHIGVYSCDDTIGGNDISHAFGSAVQCRLTRAISEAEFAFCIAQQRVIKILCVGKFGIGSNIVCAHAQNLHILGRIVVDSRLESRSLSRSAPRACPRIKPEHDGLAAIMTEPHLIACVIFDRKIRRDIANSEHNASSKKLTFLQTLPI